MYSGNKLRVSALENGLVELCFDAKDGSVNVFNNETVAELGDALKLIENEQAIQGMLITSGKGVFIVGADITEFENVFTAPDKEMKAFFDVNNQNLNRIESLPFPTVVAINGFALGGGLEFCLACDYRVMSSKAQIGLPETGLGIIPGWGGTVRMPRLIGLELALQWVASGKNQAADAALQSGLVSQAVAPEELREASLSFLNEVIAKPQELEQFRTTKTEALSITLEQAEQLAETVKGQVCARSPQLQAPASVIEMMTQASQLRAKDAAVLEMDLFVKLAQTDQSRALVGNFMNSQYVKRVAKNYAKSSKLSLDKASIVGAGIMGGGIAYQNALKGIDTVMKDIAEPALDLGMSEASKLLDKKVRQGRMTEELKAKTLARITPTLESSEMTGSSVIVEAVVENPKVKEMVLPELENSLAKGGVLVSNTSTISISRLAKALKKPEQFAGLHFFNPVHAMPLVEVIRGDKTSDQTIADLVAYTLALGKQPIVVNDCPAFLVNRVLFPYFRGFEQLVNHGVDFRRIDEVMQAWGWPMGPAYLSDVIGVDTLCHCIDVLADDFPDRMSKLEPSILAKLNAAERLGQKNDKGFYRYRPDEKGRPQREDDTLTNTLVADCQTGSADCTDEDIVLRCMLPMAIEMARCLEEAVVASPAEGDMALLMGLGFPAFRGGIVRWMDEVGLATLCQKADQYAETLGSAYIPTEGMYKMASEHKTYY